VRGSSAGAWAYSRRALSRLLPHYHRDANMNRASQVLAQGVPTSYRAHVDACVEFGVELADIGGVLFS